MIKDKNFSIKMYVINFWGIAGRGTKEDKDEIILGWLDYFSYIKTDEELMLFIKACQGILDEEHLPNMPTPGYVKIRMLNMRKPPEEVLRERSVMPPKFKEVWDKWSKLFGKENKTEADKKNMKELSVKMIAMTKR